MPRRLAASETAPELVQRRTRTGKVFQIGPNKFRFASAIAPVHVPSDFAAWKRGDAVFWDDPDVVFETNITTGAIGVRNVYYRLVVSPGEIGYDYQSRDSGFLRARLVALDGVAVSSIPSPRIAGEELWWDEVRPGLDIFLRVGMESCEVFKKLHSDVAPRSFTWQIEESDPPILSLKTITMGQDNCDLLEPSRIGLGAGRQRRPVELLHSQTPFQSPLPGVRRYRITETWTGRTFIKDRTPEQAKTFFDDCVYPVLIDQDVSESISAVGDDGQQVGTTTWANDYGGTGDHYFGDGLNTSPGYRFQTVAIPNAATIDAATFTITVASTFGTVRGPLVGNDTDDAPAWATNAGPQNMTPTAASIAAWSPPASGTYAVNVASIVAEITSRAGWVSGANLAFGVQGTITGGGSRYIEDLNGGASGIATLTVDYTAAGGAALPRSTYILQAVNRASTY